MHEALMDWKFKRSCLFSSQYPGFGGSSQIQGDIDRFNWNMCCSWYQAIGWPTVSSAIFAFGQGALLWLATPTRDRVVATGSESEPLLKGSGLWGVLVLLAANDYIALTACGVHWTPLLVTCGDPTIQARWKPASMYALAGHAIDSEREVRFESGSVDYGQYIWPV